jgi:hypothetical protein
MADAPSQRGQATVELIGAVPMLLLAGLSIFQLMLAGYTATLADGAVEAGAVAAAGGEDVEAAVRAALPGWERGRVEVSRAGGRVSVTLRPPSPFAFVSGALDVSESAWVRTPDG